MTKTLRRNITDVITGLSKFFIPSFLQTVGSGITVRVKGCTFETIKRTIKFCEVVEE